MPKVFAWLLTLMLSKIKSCTSDLSSLNLPSNVKNEFSPIQDKKLPDDAIALGLIALQLTPASCIPYTKGEPT